MFKLYFNYPGNIDNTTNSLLRLIKDSFGLKIFKLKVLFAVKERLVYISQTSYQFINKLFLTVQLKSQIS